MTPEDFAAAVQRQAVLPEAAEALLQVAVGALLVIQARSFEEGSICMCCWEHNCREGCPARDLLEATCLLDEDDEDRLGFFQPEEYEEDEEDEEDEE